MRQFRLELVEAGLSETGWTVPNHTRHCAAYAVLCISVFGNQILHASRDLLVGTSDGQELVDLVASDGVEELEVLGVGGSGGVLGSRREEELVSDRGGETDNLDSVRFAEVLLCDCASCDSACVVLVVVVVVVLAWLVRSTHRLIDSPIVSRALLLPPPELALTPYFSKYVQSAWLGLGYMSIVWLP